MRNDSARMCKRFVWKAPDWLRAAIHQRARYSVALVLVLAFTSSDAARAQEPVERILDRDQSLNNLVTPAGYETGTLGELGEVLRAGKGDRTLVLVPGLGFGARVFEPLFEAWGEDFSMIAVTLPGFGGTAAPPTPPAGTSFAENTWTRAATDAVVRLIEQEDLRDAVVLGHWIGGTQVAIGVGEAIPERIASLLIVAGGARFGAPNDEQPDMTLTERIELVDERLAPGWFQYVTRETWDDNNFLPGDYAVNPVVGLRLWRQAARPRLHVWIRYLCELYAQDSSERIRALDLPILALVPDVDDFHHDDGEYMYGYLRDGWGDSLTLYPRATVRTIPDTRLVMWFDDLAAVSDEVRDFLASAS